MAAIGTVLLILLPVVFIFLNAYVAGRSAENTDTVARLRRRITALETHIQDLRRDANRTRDAKRYDSDDTDSDNDA